MPQEKTKLEVRFMNKTFSKMFGDPSYQEMGNIVEEKMEINPG